MIVHPRLSEERFTKALQPLLDEPEFYASLGVRLVAFAHPVLYVALSWARHNRRLCLCVDGTDFDYRPVSGWFVDENNAPLPPGQGKLPTGGGFHANGPPFGVPRCWFCFQGWREFHEHDGHSQETPWPVLRKQAKFAPLALIKQLHSDLQRDGVTPT